MSYTCYTTDKQKWERVKWFKRKQPLTFTQIHKYQNAYT